MEGRYLGLYGFWETILVQPVTLQAGRPVLKRLRLGEQPTPEIGSLRLVNYSTRSETLVRSLVACGTTSATELPCWFNQTLHIDRIATAGTGRPLELLGLTSRPLPTPHPDRMDIRGRAPTRRRRAPDRRERGGECAISVRDHRPAANGL